MRTVALDRVSPPRLYFALLRRRFTGKLSVEQQDEDPQERTVWFRGGMPVYTDWTSQPDLLGEVLIEEGRLTRTDCDRALGIKIKDGGLLGQVLLGMGAIEADDLSRCLSLQCARKLVHTFALRSGTATVSSVAHDVGEGDALSVPVNVLNLIRDGVWAHYDAARVVAEMGTVLDSRLVATAAFSRYRERFGFSQAVAGTLDALMAGAKGPALRTQGGNELANLRMLFCVWACQMLRVGVGDGDGAAEVVATAGESSPPTSAKVAAENGPERAKAAEPVGAKPKPAKPKPAKPRPAEPVSAKPKPAKPRPAKPKPAKPEAKPEPKAKPVGASPDAEAGDDQTFLARLVELEKRLEDEAHAFALFDLELDASKNDVRRQWAELSRIFHPDALEAEGRGELRERVQRVFAALSEAHSVLGNKDKRNELRKALNKHPKAHVGPDPSSVVRNAIAADREARAGDKLLRSGNYARALEAFERALDLHPDDTDVVAAATWCRFQTSERTREDATKAMGQLDKLLEKQANCARAHYFLGMIRLHIGLDKMALVSFDSAFEADSKLIDAQRQARAIRIKQKQGPTKAVPAKKGFSLKGLFGRRSS